MIAATPPKDTAFPYGETYQREQIGKHRSRATNHWRERIALAHSLVEKWALPRLAGRDKGEINVLDVGCSIGTMAIEFAARGFRAYGIDFDAVAIEMGRQLCREEGVCVEFQQGDVSDWQSTTGAVDIALCFDIFEHLHDDELGAMLRGVKRQLSPTGTLLFYSFPLQFDYIFFSRNFLSWPLVPFRWCAASTFQRITRAYAALLDCGLMLATGQNYRDRISKLSHCNPTTPERLKEMLARAGYEVACMETTNIYPFKQPYNGASPVSR